MAKETFSDYGASYSDRPETKKANRLILILTGVFVLFIIILGGGLAGKNVSTPSASQSQIQTKTETKSPAVDSGCFTINTDITMIKTAFEDGKNSPQEVGLLLQAAASDWSSEASNFSGSKSEWLKKMSELATKLRGYILTGSPSNGEQLLSQLFNNFNLASNFCS